MTKAKAKTEDKAMNIIDITSEVGMAMHTALRKACDSPPTLAWNAIHLMEHAWAGYAKLVASALLAEGRDTSPLEAAKTAMADMQGTREDVGMEWLGKENANHERWTLICIFKTFEDEDWDGMIAYLDEDFLREICGR